MNRAVKVFSLLKKGGEGALIPYVPVYPDINKTMKIVEAYIAGGADMIEISVPSARPWIDGPTLQRYHKEALMKNVTLVNSLKVAELVTKEHPEIPIWLIFYLTEALSYDPEELAEMCSNAGIDIVDAPNYPIDDPFGLSKALEKREIYMIIPVDLSTATAKKGDPQYKVLYNILRAARGAIFLMLAAGGLAGIKKEFPADKARNATNNLRRILSELNKDLPIIGVTGISNETHVRRAVKDVGLDGVMMGSAFVKKIQEGASMDELKEFTRLIKQATIFP